MRRRSSHRRPIAEFGGAEGKASKTGRSTRSSQGTRRALSEPSPTRISKLRASDDVMMNPAIDELGADEIWKEPVDRLLSRLGTTAAGLDAAEVQSRLKTFGPNDAAVV